VPAFSRLVIESTGLADPFPILTTLRADPVLGRHVALASVIATVDAVNASAQLAGHRETLQQIASADRIVLTKTDLVEMGAVHALSRRLGALNPGARVLDVQATDWSAADLVTTEQAWGGREGQRRPAMIADDPGEAEDGRHRSDGDIAACSISVERPVDWTRFGLWLGMLLNRHGARILRVKGILALVGEERPVAIHGVRHLVHPPTHMGAWPTSERRSRIVFITDGIPRERILASLAAFGLLDDAERP
jgi:G3E family GTPase